MRIGKLALLISYEIKARYYKVVFIHAHVLILK